MIQTLLFVAGVNTLTHTLFGTRLPAVIGASYTFVPTTLSIVLVGRYSDLVDPEEKFEKIMRGTHGALIVASTLQIVLGFSGLWRNVFRFMSPLSIAPLVSLTGFGLYEFGFPLDTSSISISMGSSYIRCWRSFCYDGCIICCLDTLVEAEEDAAALRAKLNSLQQQAISSSLISVSLMGNSQDHLQALETELANLKSQLEVFTLVRRSHPEILDDITQECYSWFT